MKTQPSIYARSAKKEVSCPMGSVYQVQTPDAKRIPKKLIKTIRYVQSALISTDCRAQTVLKCLLFKTVSFTMKIRLLLAFSARAIISISESQRNSKRSALSRTVLFMIIRMTVASAWNVSPNSNFLKTKNLVIPQA